MTYMLITGFGLASLVIAFAIVYRMARFDEEPCEKCGSIKIETEKYWFCKGCGITEKEDVC